MATWHQNKARSRGAYVLYDKTRWSVVSDPPNESSAVMLFSTMDKARAHLDQLKANNPEYARHAYILPPGGYGA